ncbi:ADP-ribosylglycohydrolase [Paenibacillus algorifonticola]|uniref:ADP-ribosylglycohydrolase n=1 Tax=Paenibacillus algorifonticola TaxID=684063 RepID=A0A1I2GAA9_9BACL|nr:ADP-ribosylglycohydrolase family protein [Paenibacillus algorifonticola]SFF14674.1 ADP-ribosylglycohydrolase [Paenibacillus algorifonticola]
MNLSIQAGLIGLCIGDALGVPVEFCSRKALMKEPLTDMIGYGSHQQPPGTWSDDASLTLCLVESLAHCKGVDVHDVARRFVEWKRGERWTPHGEVFDIGIATSEAIARLARGAEPELAGGIGEYSNGNGSLMRILPMAYWLLDASREERSAAVGKVSSLTHRHPLSIMACVYYTEYAVQLLMGHGPQESYTATNRAFQLFYAGDSHLERFERLLSGQLANLNEDSIASSGYVMHTLEASIWSLLTTDSYAAAVLRAINLGEDTDTTGAVTGGLAGIYYGLSSIPSHWLEKLVRADELFQLCDSFNEGLAELKR